VTETYDPHTTFDSANPAPTSGEDVWQIGSLPPGASGTIVISVRVLDDVPIGTTLRNQALLRGDGLSDVSATAYTSVGNQVYLPIIAK
jgi:hypothetical protein